MSTTLPEGGGGQGLPPSQSPAQQTTTGVPPSQTQQPQPPFQQQQQPPFQQQQYPPQYQQPYYQQPYPQQPGPFPTAEQLARMGKNPDAPSLAVALQQPAEPAPMESLNLFFAIFIPLCAFASLILLAIGGSTTISADSAWRLNISATVLSAVGVMFFTVLKRMFANESQQDAENALGIAVLSHANIRAVAVRALAMQHYEIKKAETAVRDVEVIVILIVITPAIILSGIATVFQGSYSLSIVAAYFDAVAASLTILFEAKESALRISAQRIEEQLKRNSLVAEFLRADAGKKHTILQDRVESLSNA